MPLLGGTVFIVLVSCVFSSRLIVKENITTLMPASPPHLVTSFNLLQQAPFIQAMTITVGKENEKAVALADTLATALQSPSIPHIIRGPGSIDPSLIFSRLCDATPSLLPLGKIDTLVPLVQEEAIKNALQNAAQRLVTTKGIGMREYIAKDPLGISKFALAPLQHLSRPGGMQIQEGHLVDATGRYAMLLAKPAFSMADATAARIVLQQYRRALDSLPQDTDVFMVSGHRYTEENADIIQADLSRIFPISLVMLAVAFIFFLRSRQGILVFLVPVLAFNAACAGTALVYGSISGIVIGFGSVLLGITADYPIHVYYAVRSARTIPTGIKDIALPLLICSSTTLAVFATLYSSDIPGIMQMATFAIIGIVVAVFCALVVLPHYLRSDIPSAAPISALPVRICPTLRLFMLWAGIILFMVYCLTVIKVDGDIRKLSYASADIVHDEERTREIWGTVREGTMIVAKARNSEGGLEAALTINDHIWETLTQDPALAAKVTRITSLAPLLPSKETQSKRQAQWQNFWHRHANATLASVSKLTPEYGFSSTAFTPFAKWINSTPQDITAADLSLSGFGLLFELLVSETTDETFVFTLLGDNTPLSPATVTALEEHGASLVSGSSFRDDISAATRAVLLRFCTLSLLVIVGVTLFLFKNITKCALILLPMGVSISFVLAVFSLLDLPITIFHAMALPLIIALSLDYGVFMVASIEGTLDALTKKSIMLSALTTISGFGCLILARHPALFSLGLTVFAGMIASAVTALWIVPWLGKTTAPAQAAQI